ncbi:HEAT repeat domain-containing protein [Brevibacillus choshinensis]|uniref:HEAT repeat domain-containing protein n=1 Tax=Brevibacillus choshinensis TaxID=54911 RepID=UPI002E22A784|nr:HEAT repeat domain-containing protein [Brevibacillus choshinensis]MED4752536.1 HEAT repeat domain-containing protein [Brevibacillus choshinensis]MED4782864.1 HEAT repeat domain-containing protein [Brevibacillus choshinensis]
MNTSEVKNEFPPHYEDLKKSANRTSNWRERLEAVEELGKWKDAQTIGLLKRILINDSVYKVQQAAFYKLKGFGEAVQLPPQKKGDLIKGTTKSLVRIKKSLPKGHTFEEFREKLQKMRTDIYDSYEGEKGDDFDQWLESTWASL